MTYLKKAFLVNILTIFILSSCQSTEELIHETLIGQWVVEQIDYKGQSMKDSVLVNFLSIDDSIIEFPEFHQDRRNQPKTLPRENHKYKYLLDLNDGKRKLVVLGEHPVYSGNYDLKFFKDQERPLLMLELESSETRIILSKLLFGLGKENLRKVRRILNE